MTHYTGSDEGLSELLAAHYPLPVFGCECTPVDEDSGVKECLETSWERHVATVILAARATAPDALRERVEALCDKYDAKAAAMSPEDDWGASVSDTLAGDTIRAVVSHIRAALAERPTDGAGT